MHPTQETPGSEQRQPLVVLRGSTRKHHHTVADSLRIDPDFQTLIPPLSASEFATLYHFFKDVIEIKNVKSKTIR
ncbi:hypothetical protein [Microcoleus sp. Pol12A6]|uniref:hypothetical protein n=1 Tax=Microcoleus sp. Pol12A6 TaxID=3055393 RepID=UPI002FD5C25B